MNGRRSFEQLRFARVDDSFHDSPWSTPLEASSYRASPLACKVSWP